MSKTSTYSALNVAATLDGVPVLGLFDGDNAIQIDLNSDIGTGLVGVQGDSMFSQSTDNSASVTLRLFHTSPTHRQLVQKMNAQKAGSIKPFRFDCIETASGEGGNGDQFFVQRAPSDAKGKVATVREWIIWTGDYSNNVPNE